MKREQEIDKESERINNWCDLETRLVLHFASLFRLEKRLPNCLRILGGVMLWEVTTAEANGNYAQGVRGLLGA